MTWKARIETLARERWWYAAVSGLLLPPCFWQPRLQAGDLSSHMYNAWLTQLVESGRTEGLMTVRHSTDILFDLMLDRLFHLLGPEFAQRIAVSVSVLVFVWGAFAFVSAVVGRRSWHIMPCLAMLAYGWVFHMGFFNFYLSLGLCFWGMSLAWDMIPRRVLWAVPLFGLAYLAHALPVIWTLTLLTYICMARHMTVFHRVCLTAGFVGFLVGLHGVAGQILLTRWSAAQLSASTGVERISTLDSKYYWVLMGLSAVWAIWFLSLLRDRGARQVVASIPFQLCVISAAAVFVLPGTVLIPGFYHALSYIGERMSVGVAVCVCALLGAVRPRRIEKCALAVVSIAFFALMYVDERAINSIEDRLQDLISQVTLIEFGNGPAINPPGRGPHRSDF